MSTLSDGIETMEVGRFARLAGWKRFLQNLNEKVVFVERLP